MTCNLCQNENQNAALFCSRCGVKLHHDESKNCVQCGTRNTLDSHFCRQCGNTLIESNALKDSFAPRTERSASHFLDRILEERQTLAEKGVPEGERKTV